jgi:hypothetical protein
MQQIWIRAHTLMHGFSSGVGFLYASASQARSPIGHAPGPTVGMGTSSNEAPSYPCQSSHMTGSGEWKLQEHSISTSTQRIPASYLAKSGSVPVSTTLPSRWTMHSALGICQRVLGWSR